MFARLAASRLWTRASAARAALNAALLALWVWLYHPLYEYFKVIFTEEEFRTNQIVLASVAGLLLYRVYAIWRREGRLRLRIDAPARLYLPALLLVVLCSLAYLLAERFLNINTLSAVLFALSGYGLLGLWLDPRRWRQGIPAALLVIGVLPFGAHLETFAGYPLRIVTAELVRGMLASMGFHAVGVDTILVFESGVSQVDIPCSGIKSLWTGALFLLAATWIEDRPVSLRWLLIAALTGALLVASNLLRVAALALTGPALGVPLLAEMLHLPLGMLGFAASIGAALLLIRRLPVRKAASTPEIQALYRPVWLAPLLAAVLLAMALAYTPRAEVQAQLPAPRPAWSFPQGMAVEPAPLSAQELEWIREGGAENADRYTFTWQGPDQPIRGTVMFVTSQTWRGQHRPELCFQVFGYTVRESITVLAAPDFPLRSLSLSHPAVQGRSQAAYWLQSASQITDDYGQRIWADLRPDRERWVLVTVLFDPQSGADAPVLDSFYNALRASISRSLHEGENP